MPFRYTVDGGELFAFAGPVGRAKIGGERVDSATILTTSANAVCAPVHDRMPCVLAGPDEEAAWLSGELDAAAGELLVPLAAARATVRPANPAVNKAGVEGPELLTCLGRARGAARAGAVTRAAAASHASKSVRPSAIQAARRSGRPVRALAGVEVLRDRVGIAGESGDPRVEDVLGDLGVELHAPGGCRARRPAGRRGCGRARPRRGQRERLRVPLVGGEALRQGAEQRIARARRGALDVEPADLRALGAPDLRARGRREQLRAETDAEHRRARPRARRAAARSRRPATGAGRRRRRSSRRRRPRSRRRPAERSVPSAARHSSSSCPALAARSRSSPEWPPPGCRTLRIRIGRAVWQGDGRGRR